MPTLSSPLGPTYSQPDPVPALQVVRMEEASEEEGPVMARAARAEMRIDAAHLTCHTPPASPECWCCGAPADVSGNSTCACSLFPAEAGGPTCTTCEFGLGEEGPS